MNRPYCSSRDNRLEQLKAIQYLYKMSDYTGGLEERLRTFKAIKCT